MAAALGEQLLGDLLVVARGQREALAVSDLDRFAGLADQRERLTAALKRARWSDFGRAMQLARSLQACDEESRGLLAERLEAAGRELGDLRRAISALDDYRKLAAGQQPDPQPSDELLDGARVI